MTGVYLPNDMKRIDRTAIELCGIPSVQLMESAAQALSAAVRRLHPDGAVYIFCGTGNNGGDGLAAARFLSEYPVRCFLVGDEAALSEDAAVMLARLRDAGGEAEPFRLPLDERPALVIDALFGFSFHGALRGDAEACARWINESSAAVIACDLPSGVDPETGAVNGTAVRADVTVTMTGYKPGLLLPPGSEYAGRVEVADIGIPDAALVCAPVALVTDRSLPAACYPRRRRNSHKGDYGKVLLLCGSTGYTGAAALAARAALRAGSGLVFLGVPEPIYPILAAKLDEAIVFPLPAQDGRLCRKALPEILSRLPGMDACLLGPGLGCSEETEAVVCAVLLGAQCPVLLDADGITALSRHMDILQSVSAPLVLTPHDGEFARLLPEASDSRLVETARFAAAHRLVLLRKGYRTLISDGETTYCNPTGNPGMAVGGSGDTLSGLLVSLLGRGVKPLQAAAAAAWLHGAAGDAAAARLGEESLLPGDLTQALCEILKHLED